MNQSTAIKKDAPILFEKRTIVEISSEELTDINGGSTPVCMSITSVGAGVGLLYAGYRFGRWLAS